MKPLDRSKIKDDVTRGVVQSHDEAITEFQALPIAGMQLIRDVVVVNNNTVIVPHGLGREPVFVMISAIRWDGSAAIDAGTVFDRGKTAANGSPIDRKKFIHLAADNFTTTTPVTLTFDVVVF